MIESDYMYPAPPGVLRRGTPVVHRSDGVRGVVVNVDGDDVMLASVHGGIGWTPLDLVALDLSDVTARAHAAWVYTVTVRRRRILRAELDVAVINAAHGSDMNAASRAKDILLRMTAGDESVTIEEARAALDWAHEKLPSL